MLLVSSLLAIATSYPFQDPSLPVATRVDDLISRLTLR
jgi:hypothetical protein